MQLRPITRKGFQQFCLKSHDLTKLKLIQQNDQILKTLSLIQGCQKRQQMKLYQSNKAYYEDLQIILDNDRQNGPSLLKQHNIIVNEDGNRVMPQCYECGEFKVIWKFCNKCFHVHYCSEACEMRSKLNHQNNCKLRLMPTIDIALMVQLHLGSDLGNDIRVYYQQQMRMSLKLRGNQMIKQMDNYFNGEAKNLIPDNFVVEKVDQHLQYRKMNQSTYNDSNDIINIEKIQQLQAIYANNHFLSLLQIFLLKNGAILAKRITEVHDNHIHLIYIFLCCV